MIAPRGWLACLALSSPTWWSGYDRYKQVSRGFEPRSLDSESSVLSVTPRGQVKDFMCGSFMRAQEVANVVTSSMHDPGKLIIKEAAKASRGFEPRSLDSESRVLTVTPRGQMRELISCLAKELKDWRKV